MQTLARKGVAFNPIFESAASMKPAYGPEDPLVKAFVAVLVDPTNYDPEPKDEKAAIKQVCSEHGVRGGLHMLKLAVCEFFVEHLDSGVQTLERDVATRAQLVFRAGEPEELHQDVAEADKRRQDVGGAQEGDAIVTAIDYMRAFGAALTCKLFEKSHFPDSESLLGTKEGALDQYVHSDVRRNNTHPMNPRSASKNPEPVVSLWSWKHWRAVGLVPGTSEIVHMVIFLDRIVPVLLNNLLVLLDACLVLYLLLLFFVACLVLILVVHAHRSKHQDSPGWSTT